jgi:hypothetical protein
MLRATFYVNEWRNILKCLFLIVVAFIFVIVYNRAELNMVAYLILPHDDAEDHHLRQSFTSYAKRPVVLASVGFPNNLRHFRLKSDSLEWGFKCVIRNYFFIARHFLY